MCMTAEYPAVIILLCSRIIRRTSNTDATDTRLSGEHATNPGRTSSSSIPFTRSRTLSPGSATLVSFSSSAMPSTTNSDLFGISTSLSFSVIRPASSFPNSCSPPISLYFSKIGSFTGALTSRSGGFKWSRVSIKLSPSYHGQIDLSGTCLRFIPVSPDAGIQLTSPCFHPTDAKNGHSFFTHSSYRSFDHDPSGFTIEGSSILLMITTSWRTPDVFASMACSRV
mmetsp:Transcript_6873/g.12297  ORF Transcript_6873/g.12297 Transcript_6873/m.12297 type:complete len:225 (-) Transcript_6873:979-1653(-)